MEWLLAVLGIGGLLWAARRVIPGRTRRHDAAETLATTGFLFWAFGSGSTHDTYPSDGSSIGGSDIGSIGGGGIGGGD